MQTEHCSRCNTRIPVDVLSGHCPACLLELTKSFPTDDAIASIPGSLRRFGDYELLAEIARGGMGVVYRARQISLNRIVALKMVLAGEFARPDFVQRFRREAQAAAHLQHPNIVAIHEIGEQDGLPYFTMDCVEGPQLAELVRDGPVPINRAAAYMERIAAAVHFAHEHGILHRDLKPSNILIDPFDQPRITDFGLARTVEAESHLTQTGQTLGSPAYMSPEQADSQHDSVGIQSDLYSLGAVLYHLLTGRAPFQAETIAGVLLQVQQDEPVPPRRLNPSVPLDLETICLKCLEKDPGRRYATAQELADELACFLRSEPIKARPLSSFEKLARWCRRQPLVAALAGSVALLLFALAVAASVAAFRIDLARRAEHEERENALKANARLGETVRVLELQRAESFFRSGYAGMALAHLAAVLRRDSSNHIAAERVMSALLNRNWVLPAGSLPHPGKVYSVSFSSSGQFIATGGADGFARVWDSRTRQEVARLAHSNEIRGVCFSPDDAIVAIAYAEPQAELWNWRQGRLAVPPMPHKRWVLSVSFSPDGQRLVTGSGDHNARIWSARTGEWRLTLRGHTDEVRSAVFSPDARLVATASHDGSARLWNSDTGQPVGPILKHDGMVLGAAFSPDGRWLATASRDRTAILWLVDQGTPALPPFRHPGGLNGVTFDRRGHIIATVAFDNTVRLWDAENGTLLSQPFRHFEQVNQAAFSPDGRMLATAGEDRRVRFWEIRPGAALIQAMRHASTNVEVTWMEFSADGQRVVTASEDHTVRIWDSLNARPVGEPLRHSSAVRCARFSRDGQFVATACADGRARIWQGDKIVYGPFAHSSALHTLEFSSDGRRLVVGCGDGSARIWDVAEGKEITPPLMHQKEVTTVSFSPDGARVMTASQDHTARIWNAETGAPITESLRHADRMLDACFSPDGLRIATASKDNTAKVWDARTGKLVGRPLRHLRTVQSVAFSPDGRQILTASLDHTARLWDALTSEPLTSPLEHDEGVWNAVFSPDGKRIVTAAGDGTARLWDAKSGLPLSDPLVHPGTVRMARFSSDGQRLATVTQAPDAATRIWQVPEASLPIPAWLPELAEAVAGLAMGPHGTTRLISENEFAELKERAASFDGQGAFHRLARWMFADRNSRTISPFQSETVSEYVQRRIAENTSASLEEAVLLDPANGIALARLAAAVAPTNPEEDPRRAAEARHLAKRALQFSPDLPEAQKVLDRMSH